MEIYFSGGLNVMKKLIKKESKLMRKLIRKNSGVRYNWEDVKKELFENVPAKPIRRSKKVSKKDKI